MYKLNVNDSKNNFNFNIKYGNLEKLERPEVVAKAPNGNIVKESTTYEGKLLPKGSTQRQWLDEQGNIYAKGELTFWYNNEQVQEKSMTKIFNITSYEPLVNYTDKYIISTYYEVMPHDNDMKKDIDKEQAVSTNIIGMKKLFDYLTENNVVARGEFSASSKGFLTSDAFIRSIKFGNHWTLELGVFSQEKVFKYLQEGIPSIVINSKPELKKIKMI
jgi:hypothetical protein